MAVTLEVLSVIHMDKKTQNVQEECGICEFQISYQTAQLSRPLILIFVVFCFMHFSESVVFEKRDFAQSLSKL